MSQLVIKNLHVTIEGTEIIRGLSLTMNTGEIHAIMGPNGTGKSTLAYTLMGHPSYEVTAGEILLDGEDVLEMEPNERALAGLFLAFQYPSAVPGVSIANFLRMAVNARRKQDDPEDKGIPLLEFRKLLIDNMDKLKVNHDFAGRYLNDGFSGGEKKRVEVLQMLTLKPTFAILDEPDSGLDIDAIKIVADGVNAMRGENFGGLMITHYQRILDYVKPDFVHVMMNGKIIASGGPELALELEANGYEGFEERIKATA
ncbi:MAG: Fe-S cluster assembly ATPase SufC [Anaerolineae bacterium]|jgi:Fe-S cluster assembly ATP-binding protein|nr:Fe-S cluster assembly ATPase SufC [Anaerolineae bacterium]